MQQERINLTQDGRVYVDVYIQNCSVELPLSYKRPFVLVCPGGGYVMTSDREAEPIAMAYLANGFNAAVLRYSVGEYAQFPRPLVELSRTIKLIRENADKWYTDADKITVIGFSAGGHLVASLGVYWNDQEIAAEAECFNQENKPNAIILGYPVILGDGLTHGQSINYAMQNITDPKEREEYKIKLSCDLHVGEQTPPAFIFHTYTDNSVPVEASLAFASAMAKANRPFELHVFEQGEHGLALANNVTYKNPSNLNAAVSEWVRLSCNWLWNMYGRNVPQEQRYVNRKRGMTL